MYVNPEVWLLPLRWRENTVQLFPPTAEPERHIERNTIIGTPAPAGLGFASVAKLKNAAGAVAASARSKAAATTGMREGATTVANDDWRLWQPRGGSGGGSGGDGVANHRRATISGGFTGGASDLATDTLSYCRHPSAKKEEALDIAGADGARGLGTSGDGAGNAGTADSAAEVEVRSFGA